MRKTTLKKTGWQITFGILLLLPLLNQAQSTAKKTATDYCQVGTNNYDFESIGQFGIGNFKSTVGTSSGYTNNTNITIDLIKGESYLISLKPSWGTDIGFSAGYTAWIDYNGDKIFNNADEAVWAAYDGDHTSPILGIFKVSENAIIGTTRLRVAMQFAYMPPSCGIYDYGEVEDYTVNIIEGAIKDPLAPLVPINLTASDITETQIHLSWTAPASPDIAGYDIYQDQILIGTSATTSYTVTGLQPKTAHLFTIKAKNANGNISESSVPLQAATIPDVTPPTVPNNFAGTAPTSLKTTLSWDASTDIVSGNNIVYNIYNGTTFMATTKNNSFSFLTLTPGTTYNFKLVALDEAKNSTPAANLVTMTTLIDKTPPTPPTNLIASDITASSVTLSWTPATDNEDVLKYYVYVGADLKRFPMGDQTSIVMTDLTDGTPYTFTLIAVDKAGNESQGVSVIATTVALPKYCAVNSLDTKKKFITQLSVNFLSNHTDAGANGYSDFTAKSTKLTKGVAAPVTIIPWIDPVLNTNSPINVYYIWIDYNGDKDFDDAGELAVKGSSTSSREFTSTLTVPATALNGKTRMRIMFKEGSSPATPNPCGTFSFGEVEDYTVDIQESTLGVDEHEAANPEVYILHPNPVYDKLFIQSSNNVTTTFRITNITGQLIKNGKINENSIDVSKLSSGVYIIELNDEEKSTTKKFIKN